MDWRIYLGMGIGILLTIASIVVALRRILEFLSWVFRPMLKMCYQNRGSWPLKITLKSATFGRPNLPMHSVKVEFLIEPRKEVVLGKCEIVYPDRDFVWMPRTPVENDDFQEWQSGNHLKLPKTYILSFYIPDNNTTKAQIQVESGGYICKSKLVEVVA